MRKTFAWAKFGDSPAVLGRWVDRLWMLGLFLSALLLFVFNLGGLPLRDWDEGIVAQVARDIWRASPGSLTWLHPTIAGAPYLNKPPLVHWLIALSYAIGGVSEWTTRLPGAILTAASVPLLYGIGRELWPQRTPAIFAALIYLTFLPVVRHGRLAMLDGTLLCFFLLMLLCLLRTRRDLRWGLGAGLAFGCLCLTKGIVALLLGTIGLGFILLDTPRLLNSAYLWSGILLGSVPVLVWYGAQWLHYGQQFIVFNLVTQSFSRVWLPVENNQGPPWYYLVEILKYGWPWLVFLPQGFRLVWENRNMGWAKLILIWTAGFLGVISLMGTKLPWYVLPLYPALALVSGVQLSEVWDPEDAFGTPRQPRRRYPISWLLVFGFLAVAGWAACVYFSGLGRTPDAELQILAAAIATTMTVTTLLLIRRDSQFIPVLLWGMYVSLLLLTMSRFWIWELNEDYLVKPVAAIVKRETPLNQIVLTSHDRNRPSLNFYSDRQVVPASLAEIKLHWQQDPNPYVLADQSTLKQLPPASIQKLGAAESWTLITRK